MKIQRLLDIAKKLSYKSNSRFKLGCVIAYKNRPISLGHNNMAKTHPRVSTPWKTLHAEMHALLGLDFKATKGAIAYVYRQDRQGNLSNAKPCPACQTALRLAGICQVYYTHEQGVKSLKL